MKKKELLEMPLLELTEQMYAHASSDQRVEQNHIKSYVTYDVVSYFRAGVEDGILQIAVYLTDRIRSGVTEPMYRIFFDIAAKDFITFDMEEGTWRTARVDNLEYLGICWNYGLYVGLEDRRVIEDYLGLSEMSKLENWQRESRLKQRQDAYKRKTDKWEAVMKKVPDLPKDWENWLAKDAVAQHFMFYEYRKGGKITGRCSRCGKEQVLHRPKYNKKSTCRNCGYPVTYRSVGKCGNIRTSDDTAHLIQRMEGAVVSRQFRVWEFYRKGAFHAPELYCYEERRLVLNQDGTAQAYYYGEYKDHKMHWIETEPRGYILPYYTHPGCDPRRGTIYRRTLPDLSKKELKRTGILEMARYKGKVSPEEFLLSVKKKPILEKAAKAGLFTLAADLLKSSYGVEINDEGELHRCLGIDRNQLKRLRENGGGIDYLKWLQYEKKCGKKIDDAVASWFIGENLDPENISFIADRMSPLQVMNYLVRQQKKMEERSVSGVLSTWKDYLDMAKKNGMDVQDEIIYRTSELVKRHDDMIRLREKMKSEEEEREVLEKYPTLNETLASLKGKYDYQDQEYAVIVPENVADLIHEGNSLHHCINKSEQYYERIAQGESYILFLRKKESLSVPYYTVEAEPGGTIRQIRAEYNRQRDDFAEVSSFMKKWQKEIAKRLTKAERPLSEASKKMRRQEYEKLRKEGVRIGQGTYEGQLLADILEADLMEMPDAA